LSADDGRVDDAIARQVWRAWVRARGWSPAELAARLRVPLWRARQLHCGRLLVRPAELARLRADGEGFLRTLARALGVA